MICLGYLRQMGMQWPLHIHLLSTLSTSLEYLQITGNGPSFLVFHSSCLLVAHPRVCTTTTRVNPHDMLEAKILSQRNIDHLDSHGYELPAFDANVGLVATCSDVVVVCKIDIEAEFFRQWAKGRQVL